MSVMYRCDHCHKFNSVSKSAMGKVVACPKCGKIIKQRAYYVDFRINGKQVREYAGFDLTTARAMDIDKKNNKRLGKLPAKYRPAKQTTFQSFFEDSFLPHWESKNRGKKPQFIFKYFLSVFGDKALKDITPSDIERALIRGID